MTSPTIKEVQKLRDLKLLRIDTRLEMLCREMLFDLREKNELVPLTFSEAIVKFGLEELADQAASEANREAVHPDVENL